MTNATVLADRIKLAEAMFPDHAFANNTNGEPLMCHDDDWGNDDRIRNVPDPFTDANDDYAVLEWMRTIDDKRFALGHGPYGYQCTYQIGDYARAALKVIGDD